MEIMAHAVDKYILCKTAGTRMSTSLATMRMQVDLVARVAVLTNGIIMTITDTEAGRVKKVAALAMVAVTAMVKINALCKEEVSQDCYRMLC